MKKIILALSILTVVSVAQSFAPKQTKNYTVSLPIEGWETVVKGLGELPLKESEQIKDAIFQQIQTQLQAQNKQQQAPKDTTNNKPKKN
jgi:hypothetical protein